MSSAFPRLENARPALGLHSDVNVRDRREANGSLGEARKRLRDRDVDEQTIPILHAFPRCKGNLPTLRRFVNGPKDPSKHVGFVGDP